jgi:hypothetical protein
MITKDGMSSNDAFTLDHFPAVHNKIISTTASKHDLKFQSVSCLFYSNNAFSWWKSLSESHAD